MPSNLTLSADERTPWMMARCAAKGRTAFTQQAMDGRDVYHYAVGDAEADAEADAAILAMRERVAVEATGEAEPPLTPERAREVMREYPEWKLCGFIYDGPGDSGVCVGRDGRIDATTDRWTTERTITTESALRSFCEGRKA